MNKQSLIVDQFGNSVTSKSLAAPNFDPGFFITGMSTTSSMANIQNKPDLFQVWVHRAINVIASNVSQIEREIQRRDSNEIVKNHQVLSLLKRPNMLLDMSSFFYTIACYLLLPSKPNTPESGGQCFIIPWNSKSDNKVNLQKGEIPTELMLFSESFFSPEYENARTGMKLLKGWKFEIPNSPGSEMHFLNNELIRIYTPNIHDPIKGSIDFTCIADTIQSEAYADQFNNNIFANNGQLDGVMATDLDPGIEEVKKMKELWKKDYTGPNRDRVAFTWGGFKYQQLSLSTTDLGYIEQSKWWRDKVISAYGLNKIAFGNYEDINLATLREGRKYLWQDRYIPFDKIILSALNNQWIQYIDNGRVELASVYSKIPALQTDMTERVVTAGRMCREMGFPPVVASRIMNIPLTEEDIKNYPSLSQPFTQQNPLQIPISDNNDSKTKAIIKKDKREYNRDYIKRILDPVERKFIEDLNKYFTIQRNTILDKIDSIAEKNIDKSIQINVWDLFPNEDIETSKIIKVYKSAAKMQSEMEKKQVENEIKHPVKWDTHQTQIDYWTSVRSKHFYDLTAKTLRSSRIAVIETIKKGNEEGITVNEMRSNIKQAVHDVYDVRLGKPIIPNGLFDLGGMSSSKTIARTEMGNIASLTRSDIFKKEGIGRIEWITAHDEKVRSSHNDCEDQGPIRFGEEFKNGLKFPRDPNGSAEEVINCRCSFVAVIEEE